MLSIPRFLLLLPLLLTLSIQPARAADEEEDAGSGGSGLPIPRFVSFRFEEVNVRTGPGTRYPIRWVYHRKGLPMEITEEFGHWRKLKDQQGDEGWVHKSQLSGARSLIVTEDAILKRYPETDAPPMVRAKAGVVGQALECSDTWCRVQIDSYKAWLEKSKLWGVYVDETFKD